MNSPSPDAAAESNLISFLSSQNPRQTQNDQTSTQSESSTQNSDSNDRRRDDDGNIEFDCD